MVQTGCDNPQKNIRAILTLFLLLYQLWKLSEHNIVFTYRTWITNFLKDYSYFLFLLLSILINCIFPGIFLLNAHIYWHFVRRILYDPRFHSWCWGFVPFFLFSVTTGSSASLFFFKSHLFVFSLIFSADYLSFCMFGNIFILPSLLKVIFKDLVLDRRLFSCSTLDINPVVFWFPLFLGRSQLLFLLFEKSAVFCIFLSIFLDVSFFLQQNFFSWCVPHSFDSPSFILGMTYFSVHQISLWQCPSCC